MLIKDFVTNFKLSGENGFGKNKKFLTGIADLDELFASLNSGDFIVIGSRPGVGKTSLALNLSANLARQDIPVSIISSKMSEESIFISIFCSEAEISPYHIKHGNLPKELWQRSDEVLGQLYNKNMVVTTYSGSKTSDLIALIESQKSKLDSFSLLVLDDLQSLVSDADLPEFCRLLKFLAKRLNLCIIATSQVSQWVDNRVNKRPLIFDLDYKGNISGYCDKLLFLYRDEYYYPDTDNKRQAELIVAKNSTGPVGVVDLFFDGNLAKFSGLERC